MAERSLVPSPFYSDESERHPTILLVGPSLVTKTIINYTRIEFLDLPTLGSVGRCKIYFALSSEENLNCLSISDLNYYNCFRVYIALATLILMAESPSSTSSGFFH